MTDYRDEFPVTDNWVFLNHAAVAPLCRRAHDKVAEWAADMLANGNVNESKWWGEIESIRSTAANLINAEPTEIALLKNTSEGLAIVAEGFPWQPGENVVIAEGEYPANVYPWMHLRDKGVEVKTVPASSGRIEFDDIAATIDGETRMLSVSHVQFSTGFRSDLARLGALCRERKIDFCVDAIQGLGVFPIDVRAMQIDYLAADGHKWLFAPEGAAIFYITTNKVEKIRPNSVGWKSIINMFDYSTVDFRLLPNAGRYENGTFIVPGTLGLGASLSLIEEATVPIINERVKEVTDYLVDRLNDADINVVSSRADGEWSGIVSIEVPGIDPKAVLRQLREQKIIIAARAGRLRISPHFYNNFEDIDKVVEGLKSIRLS